MKLNCQQASVIAVVLQSLFVLGSKVGRSSCCTTSSFTRVPGNVLVGFVIGEIKGLSFFECVMRCTIGVNCLSLNFLSSPDGSLVCQLNNAKKENVTGYQFVQHEPGEYISFTEKNPLKSVQSSLDKGTPWYAFNQSYFKFVPSLLTFEDAMKSCQKARGHLASTSSEEELTFLNKTFVENNPDAQADTWLGLNDITEEGVYVWSDGSPVTHTKFDQNQPDDWMNEDCIAMRSNGFFNDLQCNVLRQFFCETNYSSINP